MSYIFTQYHSTCNHHKILKLWSPSLHAILPFSIMAYPNLFQCPFTNLVEYGPTRIYHSSDMRTTNINSLQHHAVMTSLLALNKNLFSVNLQISSTPGLKSRQTKHLAIGEFEAHKASFQVISRTNASHSHKAPHLSSLGAARAWSTAYPVGVWVRMKYIHKVRKKIAWTSPAW